MKIVTWHVTHACRASSKTNLFCSIWPPARLRPVGDYAPEGRAYASERKPIQMQPVFEITQRARGIAHSDNKRHKARIEGGAVSEDPPQRGLCLPR
jgi:hypothetical protein